MNTINLWAFRVADFPFSPTTAAFSGNAGWRICLDFFFSGSSAEDPSKCSPPNFLFRASFRFRSAPIVAGSEARKAKASRIFKIPESQWFIRTLSFQRARANFMPVYRFCGRLMRSVNESLGRPSLPAVYTIWGR